MAKLRRDCLVLRYKGTKRKNRAQAYVKEHPRVAESVQRLLQMNIIEVMPIGPGYVIVLEGDTRGAVYLCGVGRGVRVACVYGDGMVPPIAVQRTLDHIHGEVPLAVISGSGNPWAQIHARRRAARAKALRLTV
jgi:hypothetical protein